MANSLRDLHNCVSKEAKEQGLSQAQQMYATGWIFFDLFELADEEEKSGTSVTTADFDRFIKIYPETRISREIYNAQQGFGEAAASFMEPEILNRIRSSMDETIVARVRAYTSGIRAFGLNVLSGVISGFIFAVILLIGYHIYETDPSAIHLGKAIESGASSATTNPPAAPSPTPAPPK